MNVRNRLELHVQTLDQLNSALHLLEELRDMENKIDGIYLPIETMYAKLREFELRLPRIEIEEVDSLRESWFELMELAEQVREVLLKERRGAFEQELDKQVKVGRILFLVNLPYKLHTHTIFGLTLSFMNNHAMLHPSQPYQIVGLLFTDPENLRCVSW